jgi:hypothetical protein
MSNVKPPVLIERFQLLGEALDYANKRYIEGYRMVSFSNYPDLGGA